jgi:hypothetical protein
MEHEGVLGGQFCCLLPEREERDEQCDVVKFVS